MKEIYIVRYADDFRILCKTRNEARRIFAATQNWLRERLKLEINTEKSKIINLRKANSHFLGFRFKAIRKAHKRVVCSHMSEKAVETATRKLTDQLKNVQKVPPWRQTQEIWKFNDMVIGIHNYYALATHISKDCAAIGRIVDTVIKNRFDKRVEKEGELDPKGYIYKKYGKSRQLRFMQGQPLLPVGYIRTRYPMCRRIAVNQYTPEGREHIHTNLKMSTAAARLLIENARHNRHSVEYEDNQISRYFGQYGKCGISGEQLEFGDWHCHRIVPKELGGDDGYRNLILISDEIYQFVIADEAADIAGAKNKLDDYMLQRINRLRAKARKKPIGP